MTNAAETGKDARGAIAAVLPGLLLASAVGVSALVVKRFVPASAGLPDVLVALILGSVVINSPLGRWLGVGPHDRGRNRWGTGLNFVGKTVLRVSVVFMGLRIEAHLFGSRDVVAIALALMTALPTTYFVTHALAIPLKVPRRLADLVAAGTMICGASAINAVAPVVGARRQEQGVALATIFLYSAVALVLFRAIAHAAGLTAGQGGLWSGLAVNDLASAVAVGAQMGGSGAEMAAVSKSARVLMLAPILVMFSLSRGTAGSRADLKRTIVGHIPGFVVGFLVLTFVRAGGDALFGAAKAWRDVLGADRQIVAFATVTVSAGIGLHLELKGLLSAGARAVALGAIAASIMSGLTLALVVFAARGSEPGLLATSASALVGSFTLLQIARRAQARKAAPGEATRRRRAAAGLPSLTDSGARYTSPSGEYPAS
ncbi:MAG TPA: putative sulfate exporter family transporter [Polyangia bacterium]|nr:putative sulfate exporter family transporter [Polyangia bacterium]